MTVYETLCNQIADINYHIDENGDPNGPNMKAIPLGVEKKYPVIKDYYNKKFSVEELKKHNGNIGLVIGSNLGNTDYTFACIDIDGVTVTGVDDKKKAFYKQESAKFIFESLKDLHNTIIVKTQSGANHLYFWTRKREAKAHRISNNLFFPKDYEIKELRGRNLGNAIEIFTEPNSKFVVAPGSFVKDSKTGAKRFYQRVSDNNKMSPQTDIGVMQIEDLNQSVADCLINKGFGYEETEKKIRDEESNEERLVELRDVNTKTVKKIVDVLTPFFKQLTGMKNESYLALGGYLSKFLLPESTAVIVEKLLKATNDLNDSGTDIYRQHIQAALKNYERDNDNATGLPHIIENIRKVDPDFDVRAERRLRFILGSLLDPEFTWDFVRKRHSGSKIEYISLDFGKKQIWTYTWNINKDNQFRTEEYAITDFIPVDIRRTYNILDTTQPYTVKLSYINNGCKHLLSTSADDYLQIEDNLRRNAGLVFKPNAFKGLMNEVIGEYNFLGLNPVEDEIPIKGVFLHPQTGELMRSNNNGKMEIKKPSVNKVREGLQIWKDLEVIYPYDKQKLSSIIRWGIISPFSYIRKTQYQWIPILFLYGASKTSKTTLAEIALSLYTDIDTEISIGGSSANSEYRMEKAMKRQGIGVIINEPGRIIQDSSELIDLLKSAVESKYSREKMVNQKHEKMHAYANICFTSNNLIPDNDALIRRIRFIEFLTTERFNKADTKRFNEHFHYVNKTHNDFVKLQPVGDYIVWLLHENVEKLGCPEKELVDFILDSIFEYANFEKIEYLYTETEYMDMSNSEAASLLNLRNMIREDYNKAIAFNNDVIYNVNHQNEDGANDIEKHQERLNLTFEQNIVNAIEKNKFNYLDLKNNADHEVEIVFNKSVYDALYKYCDQGDKCKNIADMMGYEHKKLKLSNGFQVRGFAMSLDDFKYFFNTGESPRADNTNI